MGDKKREGLDETNFREFAQKAVKQHLDGGQIVAGLVWGRVVDLYEAEITKKNEALELAEKELSNIADYSGSAGNWPLHDALTKVRTALGKK